MFFFLQANTTLTSLNLARNQVCGLDRFCRGKYNAEGIIALAESLKVYLIGSHLSSLYDGQLDFLFFVLCSVVGEYEYHDAGFDK
jgi:hypothetical protein